MRTKAFFRSGFFYSLLVLIVFCQYFWFTHAQAWISAVAAPMARYALEGVWIAAVSILLAALLDPFVGPLMPRGTFRTWSLALSRLWMVASVFAFLAFEVVFVLSWVVIAGLKATHVQDLNGPRELLRYAAYVAASLPFLAATYGFAAGRTRVKVVPVDVPVAGLAPELEGLSIVQMSDLHIGEFMPREQIRRAVDMANELEPHLAVITGDFVSNHNDPLPACISELARLRAPLGVYGCNGNHEIYASAERAAETLFQQHGMKLLRQEAVELSWSGAKFNLIGVDYQRDFMVRGPHGKPLEGVEHLVRGDVPNILLSHNPNSFPRAAELGIELSLAGHTHGGQVQLELGDKKISAARLITDFVAGLYRLPMKGDAARSAFLYVNRGLGTFGFPLRLNVRPEITLLRLRAV